MPDSVEIAVLSERCHRHQLSDRAQFIFIILSAKKRIATSLKHDEGNVYTLRPSSTR